MHRAFPVIVPAIMAGEWNLLVADIEKIAHVARHVQVDVMDGHLVPSFSFPYNKTILEGQKLPYKDDIHFEAHLMVQHPQEVGRLFIGAGAKTVIAQIEGFRFGESERVYEEWHDEGAETGVSLMLDTPLSDVIALIEKNLVSIVQVMSISRVGYQGESFDVRALERIKILRKEYPGIKIAVDGGIKMENLKEVVNAGVDQIGIGSAIMQAEKPARAYKLFVEEVKKICS